MRAWLAPLLFATLCAQAPADDLRTAVAADTPYLLALYKHLHAHPELSFQEEKTAARMAAELRPLGYEVTPRVGGHGLVAVLKNGPGPVLMIRADMDGLPVTEETGLPYASKATGTLDDGTVTPVMHACGHDIHMSVWIGTARRLAATKDKWSGTLVLVGQPAEERGSGAAAMLKDGLYTRFPKPGYALALHDSAGLPAGMLAYSQGYALANVDSVDLTLRGVGGHGAYPATTKDPIVLAAKTIMALQTLVSRENDPTNPAVVTVGSVHGGTKHNIIPDEVKLQLTVRSYSPEVRQALLAGIERVARGEAAAMGMPADRMPLMTVKDEFTPSTFNTEKLTTQVAGALTARFGKDRVVQVPAVMGGEDFSRYWLADKSIESTIFWLGAVKQSAWEAAKGVASRLPSLHSSKFTPDPEPTITTGVEAMVTAAMSVVGKGTPIARREERRARLAQSAAVMGGSE
jgi:hippurate hydrolase